MHVQFQIGNVNVSLRLTCEISFDIYSGVFAGDDTWWLNPPWWNVWRHCATSENGLWWFCPAGVEWFMPFVRNCVGDYTSKKLIADVESWHVQPCTFDVADC